MISRPRVALTLLAALFLLVLPAVASAAVYEVNSTGDEPDSAPGIGGCLTAALKCTLRAAIQESNASVGTRDEITFASSFDRQLADTIVLATSLPAIADPVTVHGGDCFGEDGPDAPCAGVEGPSGGAALTVENTNGVTIEGLSVTGAQFGIDVVGSSEGFIAQNNWIGLNLLGEENGNGIGIFLDPGSDGALIGGSEAEDRNVVSGNEFDGLDLQGASEAVIRNNYFGVNPPAPLGLPGGEQKIANGKDIEITDSTSSGGIKAEDNEIGANVEGAAETSAACDGGCNVISGATGMGVDLNGNGVGQNEAPASGPTLIRGNFIGLSASGTGTVVNGTDGVYAGGADNATIGGFALGEANYLAGGAEAIVSENGDSFVVRGNRLGIGPNGSELTRPNRGILALDQSVNQTAEIQSNLVLANGVGIEQIGETGHLTGNEVIGGTVGIYGRGEPGGGLIASNYIEGASEYGILVDGPNQEVRENEVIGSGGAGIRFRNPPGIAMTGGVIGGSTTEKENLIEGSGGPAIEILEEALEPGSATEITRNHGGGNGGPFIKLVAGANGGIEPPSLAAAKQTSTSGTAEPNATVRVFTKAEASPGELQGFLVETEADGSGNWKATYPSVAIGTLVTATQTVSGATSQLAAAVGAAAEPKEESGGGGNSGGRNNDGGEPCTAGSSACTSPPAKRPPPTATITRGPKAKTKSTTAKFKFKSNEAGSTFQCKLDKGKFKGCRSPKTYKKLKPGKHVFKVRAIDKAGNVGKPASRKFTVLT